MTPSQHILKVALPVPLRRNFDYLPPVASGPTPHQGARIRVPFGNRVLVGIITDIVNSSSLSTQKLKHASEILDEQAILPQPVLQLCDWCAHYYHHPLGEVIATTLPAHIRAGKAIDTQTDCYYKLADAFSATDQAVLKGAPRQAEIIDLVRQHEHGMSQQALKALGLTGSPLKALMDRGWLKIEEIRTETQNTARNQILAEAPFNLNPEQAAAAALIQKNLGNFHSLLLEGVTGSGKTEVYLHAIHAALDRGKSALVLVPEISLTPQTVARFRHRFMVRVEALHSGLSHKERAQGWAAAATGEARIIIGTRSAVFTPMPELGIIIVDEEHDLSFKQQDGMRYSARDVAVVRAQHANIPIVLGSATPSIESLHNVLNQRYDTAALSNRAGQARLPEFQLIDIRSRPLTDGFSEPLITAIQEQINAGHQVLVFLNRRGFAPTLMCHNCGWIADCKKCDAKMTVHKQGNRLQCHHCGFQQPIPTACKSCGHPELKPIGIGTERSESALQALFKETDVIRIDRDSTRSTRHLRKHLERVQDGRACILVGTQMLAKGHHFPNVTLVAILDADAGLFSADFRGIERMAQLIMQVSGRAGRADKPGKVLMQTHQPEHPHVKQLVAEGYQSLSRVLMKEREEAQLPPYQHWAILRAEALDAKQPQSLLEHAQHYLIEYSARTGDGQIECFGPLPALMYRRNNRYRLLLILQSNSRMSLNRFMQTLGPELESSPLARRVRWSIDIDPQECF